MKPLHDEELLRRTLQEIYADYPQPSRNDWEREVMWKINIESAFLEEKKARKRTYIGWWATASAVAAVGLLLLAFTFWPQPNTPSKQQHVVAQTTANMQAEVSPIDTTLDAEEDEYKACPKETSAQQSVPKGKPKEAVRTVSRPQRLVNASPAQEQVPQAKSNQTTHTEELPPYERPRLPRNHRPAKKKPMLVTKEALLCMNDFSLAAYDRLMGLEEEQPKHEKPIDPATEPTDTSVLRRMAASPMTALGQDLQHKELAFRGASKQNTNN